MTRLASGLSIGPEDPATIALRENVATHACLYWNDLVKRWARAGFEPSDLQVAAAWRQCVECAELELDPERKADADQAWAEWLNERGALNG